MRKAPVIRRRVTSCRVFLFHQIIVMTRKQVMNATELLEAAEYLLFILDVSKLSQHSMYVDNAMDQLRRVAEASREPLKIELGPEIPFNQSKK